MTRFELATLCGLIKLKNPKNILEIGVASGGTSLIILNTLHMLNLNSKLYSCDINERYYANKEHETGYAVKKYSPKLVNNWQLFCGKTVANFLPVINQKFDIVILDTMHSVPGEILDFLCILPYVNEGSIIILHDTLLHYLLNKMFIATQLLFSCVVANKFDFKDNSNKAGAANISAFSINNDTRKYIRNIFDALLLPWSYIPSKDIMEQYDNFIFSNYPPELYNIFRKACIVYNVNI